MTARDMLTPKQVAQAIGVSESSLKRWCDRGLLRTRRTAGGHRRLPLGDVLEFLRATGHTLVRPDVLGLPSATGQGSLVIERAQAQIEQALATGDDEQCRRIAFDLYLARYSVCEICDRVVAPAFRAIGDRWEHGAVHIYQERRAIEIGLRLLYELRLALPDVDPQAPSALGGTISGDPYKLPTTMVEIALREAGWRAVSYGIDLPAETFCQAVLDHQPQLVWLSVSAIATPADFLDTYRMIRATAESCGIPLAVGGRGLTQEIRTSMNYSTFCDQLHHLVHFSHSLRKPSPAGSS